MTNKKKKDLVSADGITDFLVQDILTTSDEDILNESSEDGINVKEEAARIGGIINDALFLHGQNKLKAAKEAVAARRAQKMRPSLKISTLEKKKEVINSVNANDNLKKQITAAARNENELSESDLDVYLENLYDLGVIDENGNLLCE